MRVDAYDKARDELGAKMGHTWNRLADVTLPQLALRLV